MKTLTFTTNSYNHTVELGETIAKSLLPGQGILLTGDLGAGKTTIISGICKTLGYTGHVKSPTFVIAWLYEGNHPIYHVDLYRLDDYCELENIGWEEMTDESRIYLVEWADKFELPFTADALKLFLEYGDNPDSRKITVEYNERTYPHLEKDLLEYENNRN
ncbi:MAG: tRNA (adenosine(37)-N6)-threonylcarbamoyltransferase complex ATPase subunit type 1 TsaE [Firmicutes bacterium]|nr:tRNA (adenosine(37)-N6)-threonylcarbamoyltransferase complex ATPase subunit type 1 TsaE [Bacillota bacterium]